MPKTIRVRAGENGPVFLPAPIQGLRQIGEEPVEVELTRFIRRRLEVGDLVEDDGDDEEPTDATGAAPRAALGAEPPTFTAESGAPTEIHTSAAGPAARARRTTKGE